MSSSADVKNYCFAKWIMEALTSRSVNTLIFNSTNVEIHMLVYILIGQLGNTLSTIIDPEIACQQPSWLIYQNPAPFIQTRPARVEVILKKRSYTKQSIVTVVITPITGVCLWYTTSSRRETLNSGCTMYASNCWSREHWIIKDNRI